jgi:hypothetical protein
MKALFAAMHESAGGRFCCKSRFPLLIKIFLGRWCDSRINT